MAPIVSSIEIDRSPDDVFAFVTDVSRAPDWQENLVSESLEGGGQMALGSRVTMTRRVGGGERTMTTEVTEFDPPRSFAFRGVDGPVRPHGKGTVEPVGDGARSRFTFELDFEGHGIGMLLVPLLVRRQAQRELPKSQQNLKELLENQPAS